MKTVKLILLFLTITVLSFGQRVLTDDERNALQGDSHFLELAKKSVENYANFWAAHTGSGLADTETARIKWAKDRQLSVDIVISGSTDPLVAYRFVQLGKGIQFNIGAAPQPTATIIAAWISGNRFEEIAGSYFGILGEGINMTVGGN